jgi:hypothetical protein
MSILTDYNAAAPGSMTRQRILGMIVEDITVTGPVVEEACSRLRKYEMELRKDGTPFETYKVIEEYILAIVLLETDRNALDVEYLKTIRWKPENDQDEGVLSDPSGRLSVTVVPEIKGWTVDMVKIPKPLCPKTRGELRDLLAIISTAEKPA